MGDEGVSGWWVGEWLWVGEWVVDGREGGGWVSGWYIDELVVYG